MSNFKSGIDTQTQRKEIQDPKADNPCSHTWGLARAPLFVTLVCALFSGLIGSSVVLVLSRSQIRSDARSSPASVVGSRIWTKQSRQCAREVAVEVHVEAIEKICD